MILEETIHLDAEPERVVALLESLDEHYRDWHPDHVSFAWLDGARREYAFFEERIALAESSGLAPEHLVLDPGIDFAKQRDDNLAIYRHFERFHRFRRPLLLPVSRKTVIGDVLGIDDPAKRDAGTLACSVRGHLAGAHFLRVHDVAGTCQALRMMEALAPT